MVFSSLHVPLTHIRSPRKLKISVELTFHVNDGGAAGTHLWQR